MMGSYLVGVIVLLLSLIYLCNAGSWTEWSSFSGCSKTCGDGLITRTSQLITKPDEVPSDNPPVMTDTYGCNLGPCPVDGKWTAWGAWNKCNKNCGGGTKRRERACSNPSPAAGGEKCKGLTWEEEDCNKVSCPPIPPNFDIRVCNESYFMCASGKMCIPIKEQCNKVVQCHDGSDEDCNVQYGGEVRYSIHDGSGSSKNEGVSIFLGFLFLASLMLILH